MRGGGGEGISGNGRSDSEFVIDDDLAHAIRDRLLNIPGVREAALELKLPRGRTLHSACIAEPPPPVARTAPPAVAIGRPAPAALPPG
jgi:hypothetical protein